MDWVKIREGKVARFRENLQPEYLFIYDYLAEHLPISWAPFSGFRSLEEQQKLYDLGRTKASIELGEKRVTNARPGQSLHNWGCASDWCVWSHHAKPVWEHPDWKIYGDCVKKAGGEWAGDWITFKEMPHNQYPTSLGGRQILEMLDKQGHEATLRAIISHKKQNRST